MRVALRVLPSRFTIALGAWLLGSWLCAAGLQAAAQSSQSHVNASESSSLRQVHEALSLAERGDRNGAMALALQVLERTPSFVPALKLKAMLLEESGQSAEAARVCEQALKLAPNDPDLLLKSGIFRLAAGDRAGAIKLLERCTRILPNDGDAHYYLAQAYHLNDRDDLALPAIRTSLKVDPNNPQVWQKYGELLCSAGDCSGGLQWLLKAQHADASLPRIDFDIAATNFKLMDLPAAAQYATRAVDADREDANTLQLLATVDVKLARWQEAESAFEKLISIKPNDVENLIGLGQCQVELKRYQAAVETFHSVLHRDPTRLLAHFYLSRAYAGMGQTADSEHEAALHQLMMEHLTFVRSLENEQRESSIKAETQHLLDAHQEDSALRLYRQHFKGTSATSADAYVFLGKLYLFSGHTDDGLHCFRRALKLQPTVRGAHTYEGILALKVGDLPRAEGEFQAELTNDPSYQLAIAELGEVRYHQQRWADAAAELSKSKTMTPELLYMLCDSYFRLGKVAEANLNAEAMAAYSRNKPQVMQGLIELLNHNGQVELAQRLAAQ